MHSFSTYKLYPYGMLMPGRHEQENTYEYGFSGMRKDDEIKGQSGTSYDFGARMYDPRVGRFLSLDAFANKFGHQSPYVFAGNMPVLAIDVNGDSVWVTSIKTYDAKAQIFRVERTIHVTGKILDLSGVTVGGGGCSSPKDGMPLLLKTFEAEMNNLTAETFRSGHEVTYKFDIDFEVVNSMKNVGSSDHLIVMVDDVTYDEDFESNTQGVAETPGKIAYIENVGTIDDMVETMIHELGHNLGLGHKFNDKANYMSYGLNPTKFDYKQFQTIARSTDASNAGRNWSKSFETDKNSSWHTSTNEEPYDMSVQKGEKTPKRIYDDD